MIRSALPGPQFLVFYVLFAVIVLGLLYLGRRAYEAGALPTIEVKDPYLFACLNGGPREVIRVATIGLVDRGLLQLTGSTAHPAANTASQFGQPQIEKEILAHSARRFGIVGMGEQEAAGYRPPPITRIGCAASTCSQRRNTDRPDRLLSALRLRHCSASVASRY